MSEPPHLHTHTHTRCLSALVSKLGVVFYFFLPLRYLFPGLCPLHANIRAGHANRAETNQTKSNQTRRGFITLGQRNASPPPSRSRSAGHEHGEPIRVWTEGRSEVPHGAFPPSRPQPSPPPPYLSFREAEAVCQLLSLRSHHIMVLLKGMFQSQ